MQQEIIGSFGSLLEDLISLALELRPGIPQERQYGVKGNREILEHFS